jgi:hypothetical protein
MQVRIMAQVIWKDIIWTGAIGEMSIKDLLTSLKGHGAMELLSFEKPGEYKGELNIWRDQAGLRHITIFYLEVLGEKRKGTGRKTLKYLREIFGGDVHVQHSGDAATSAAATTGANRKRPVQPSSLFWIKMFEEKVIASMEDDLICLHENTPLQEIEVLKKDISLANI